MKTLRLKPVLTEAWEKVSGAKLAFFWVILVLAVLQLFLYSVKVALHDVFSTTVVLDVVVNGLFLFICTPFVAGFTMLGVKRARGEDIQARDGYAYFKKIIPLFIVQIMTLVTLWVVMYCVAFGVIGGLYAFHGLPRAILAVGTILLGLIALIIFLCVITSFCFTYILVCDQNKLPWQAYTGSIKMVWPHLKVLILAEVVYFLLDIFGAIPFGIGLIWTIPLSYVATGIFYREICAIQQKTK